MEDKLNEIKAKKELIKQLGVEIKVLYSEIKEELLNRNQFNNNDIIKGTEYGRDIKKTILIEGFKLHMFDNEVILIAHGNTITKNNNVLYPFSRNWKSKQIEVILNKDTKLLGQWE